MMKLLSIAYRDLIITFRDRGALILMLAAPLVITLGFGLVSGSFGGSDSGVGTIAIQVINQDEGELGQALVDTLTGEDLADLLTTTTVTDPQAARDAVDAEEIAAAVIIPASYTATTLPTAPGAGAAEPVPPAPIEIYGSAARPISAAVVEAVIDNFTTRVDRSVVTTEVAIEQLVRGGAITPAEIESTVAEISQESGLVNPDGLISLQRVTAEVDEADEGGGFNLVAFFAPGMAILFLMYTVSLGGRSLLDERKAGTLPRMMTTPTSTATIIGGKMVGIFLTGLVQLGILILGFGLILRLDWGSPLPVIVLVLAVVACATGWGLFLAAFARTPGQVTTMGTAMMLLFAIMGGTFGGPNAIPSWLEPLSRLTPNYWGLRGFLDLHLGGGMESVVTPTVWLLGVGAVLFAASTVAFRRQYA